MTGARERWTGEHLRYDIPHLRLRQVARLLNASAPKRLLDVGCATGHLRLLLPGVEYIGCDFAAPAGTLDFEFHQCDLNRERLPVGLGQFDAVACSGMLEYVDDLPALLNDIGRQLRPSGSFVCTYFNDQHVLRRLQRRLGARPYRHPDWQGLLPLDGLRDLLSATGLPVRRCYASTLGVGPAPAVAATVDRSTGLSPLTTWSLPFAHQFVLECARAG